MRSRIGISAMLAVALGIPGAAFALDRDLAVLRAKPATVLILSEIGGQVRTRCGAGPFRDVAVPPAGSTGTGFIVHPDGWILTNGHVVQRYYEQDEAQLHRTLLRFAIARACGAPGAAAGAAAPVAAGGGPDVDRLVDAAAREARVTVRKTLTVYLDDGRALPADVKVFSPPIAPAPPEQDQAMAAAPAKAAEGPGGGRDIAVLKIPGTGLPVLRLGDSDTVRVGDPVLILGYPGVVLHHELLSQATRTEASVTSGEISALRKDAGGHLVLQTDAAVSWGTSGGPMVNARGEVVGVVTFISFAAEGGGQAIQGFNFAIPINIAKAVARPAQIDFRASSPFNALWVPAIEGYAGGYLAAAIAKLERLAKQYPGQPDVERFLADARARYAALPFYRRNPAWRWAAIAMALAVSIAGTGIITRQWSKRHEAEIKRLAREELQRLLQGVQAGAAQAPGAAAGGGAAPGPVTVLDVRTDEAVARRPFALPGAIHIPPDEVLEKCQTLPVTENLVLYCD